MEIFANRDTKLPIIQHNLAPAHAPGFRLTRGDVEDIDFYSLVPKLPYDSSDPWEDAYSSPAGHAFSLALVDPQTQSIVVDLGGTVTTNPTHPEGWTGWRFRGVISGGNIDAFLGNSAHRAVRIEVQQDPPGGSRITYHIGATLYKDGIVGSGPGSGSAPGSGSGSGSGSGIFAPVAAFLFTWPLAAVWPQAEIGEFSGLAYHPGGQDVLYAIADSGGPTDISAMYRDGSSAAILPVPGATNNDWEDLAAAQIAGTDYLYVADTGNNSGARSEFQVYRYRLSDGATEQIRLTIAGNPDVECLLVDPATGNLYFVTKRLSVPEAWRVDHKATYPGVETAQLVGTIPGIVNNSLEGYVSNVVAGDARADGGEIVLKTYDRTYRAERGAFSFEEMLLGQNGGYVEELSIGYGPAPEQEPKGESICFGPTSELYTLSEPGAGHPPNLIQHYVRTPDVQETALVQGTSYAGVLDTYVVESDPDLAPHAASTFGVKWGPGVSGGGSGGSGSGSTFQPGDTRQALIRFDLSALAGQTVHGLYLDLECSNPGSGMTVHRVLVAWDASATWNSLGGGLTPGADIDAQALAQLGVGDSASNIPAGRRRVPIPVAIGQLWLDTPAANHGLALMPIPLGDNALDFRTSNYANEAQRPRLVVHWT